MFARINIIALIVMLISGIAPTLSAQQDTEENRTPTNDQPSAQKKRGGKSLFPEDVEGLEAMGNEARQEGNALRYLQTQIQLRQLQPNNPEHVVGMSVAYAMMGKKNSSFEYMWSLQKMGFAHDFDTIEEVEILRDTEVYEYLNDLLKRQGEAMGHGERVFSLGKEAALPVALDWDSTRQRFLVGTVIDGLVLAVSESGEQEELIRADEENDLWSITGLEVDADNNRLWVSTAALSLFENFESTENGQSALVEFELDTLKQVGRYLAPADGLPHEFGPVVALRNGDIFIADRLAPLVFKKPAGESAMHRFTMLGDMKGFRDMTVGPGGYFLYVSDRERGIVVIDPVGKTAAPLVGPDTLNLWGIEGLFSTEDSLVVVQSNTNPQRILKLKLDTDYSTVTEVSALAVALEDFDWPTFGAIKGDHVYYFANGQVIDPEAAGESVHVLRTELNPEEDIVAPDMARFKEQQKVREQEIEEKSEDSN